MVESGFVGGRVSRPSRSKASTSGGAASTHSLPARVPSGRPTNVPRGWTSFRTTRWKWRSTMRRPPRSRCGYRSTSPRTGWRRTACASGECAGPSAEPPVGGGPSGTGAGDSITLSRCRRALDRKGGGNREPADSHVLPPRSEGAEDHNGSASPPRRTSRERSVHPPPRRRRGNAFESPPDPGLALTPLAGRRGAGPGCTTGSAPRIRPGPWPAAGRPRQYPSSFRVPSQSRSAEAASIAQAATPVPPAVGSGWSAAGRQSSK